MTKQDIITSLVAMFSAKRALPAPPPAPNVRAAVAANMRRSRLSQSNSRDAGDYFFRQKEMLEGVVENLRVAEPGEK